MPGSKFISSIVWRRQILFGEAKLFVDYPGDWSGQKIFTFMIRALASPMLLSPLLFTDTATAP